MDRMEVVQPVLVFGRCAGGLDRVNEGVPLVTEAEFAELAEWFHENRSRLYQESLPSQLLDVGDGEKTSVADLRASAWNGPRAHGAGKLAEQLRGLKARFGDPAIGG